MKYLVSGTAGPGFATQQEVAKVLEQTILPSFDMLIKLEGEQKIVGGLPVGDRAFVFVVEAASNHEVDELLRGLPMWGTLNWSVNALQSFEARAEIERSYLSKAKAAASV